MQALQLRSTSRAFAPDPLPWQTVANLLWAAWGINRPDSQKRTAPSARNWQEIDLYVVMPKGMYFYDAGNNLLKQIAAEDLRALAGGQEFVKEAPLTLIFVADLNRMTNAPAEKKEGYAMAAKFADNQLIVFAQSVGFPKK